MVLQLSPSTVTKTAGGMSRSFAREWRFEYELVRLTSLLQALSVSVVVLLAASADPAFRRRQVRRFRDILAALFGFLRADRARCINRTLNIL